jgi:DNA-binding IclR family transcriptional regulator
MAREHRAPPPPYRVGRVSLSVSVQIQSIERAAAVLQLLTDRSRRRALGDLASELRLPRGTVYGILRTLQTVGFVEQDAESGKYQLGAALLHIGSSYLQGSELRGRALGAAQILAGETGESVRIGTLHEAHVLIVHHVPGPDERLQIPEVGSLVPLHATALGKALLAYHPRLAAMVNTRGLGSYTAATITDADRLSPELEQISRRGWASDVGEFLPWTASIAAPIQDRGESVVGAIAIAGQTARICPDRSPRDALVGHVIEAARMVSRALGGRPW